MTRLVSLRLSRPADGTPQCGRLARLSEEWLAAKPPSRRVFATPGEEVSGSQSYFFQIHVAVAGAVGLAPPPAPLAPTPLPSPNAGGGEGGRAVRFLSPSSRIGRGGRGMRAIPSYFQRSIFPYRGNILFTSPAQINEGESLRSTTQVSTATKRSVGCFFRSIGMCGRCSRRVGSIAGCIGSRKPSTS